MARAIMFRVWRDGELIAEPTVEESSIKIGSGGTAHVRLDHASVSRVHCVIDVGATLELMDLGSVSGTFVNAAPVTRTVIESGDQLRVGPFVLDVLAAEATTLLGSPVRAKASVPPESLPARDLSLRPPSLLDVSNPEVELPAPPTASVVLPRPASLPDLPRAATVELHESDLLEIVEPAGPRRGDRT